MRFAPSPTGLIHIGGFRTLMLNFLFKMKYSDSKLILRVDDTDFDRLSSSSLFDILSISNIFNIRFDMVCYQSEMLSEIVNVANDLIKVGLAYYCSCGSSGSCCCVDSNYEGGVVKLSISILLQRVGSKPFDLFNDLVASKVKFNFSDMYDLVIVRSNGVPLYNFASVVCDYLHNISLIIRAYDHYLNIWKQIAIYSAVTLCYLDCFKQFPDSIHIPLVLDGDRAKLSKRCFGVGIMDLLKSGITRTAIVGYVISSLFALDLNSVVGKDLLNDISYFDIRKIKKYNACYCYKTLESFNKLVIRDRFCSSKKLFGDIVLYFMLINESYLLKKLFCIDDRVIQRSSSLKCIHSYLKILDDNYLPDCVASLSEAESNLIRELDSIMANQSSEVSDAVAHIESRIVDKCDRKTFHDVMRLIALGDREGIPHTMVFPHLSNECLLARFRKLVGITK